MASWYLQLSSCGATANRSREDDEMEAAAAIALLDEEQCRWGGSVPGHRTYKRDRAGADKQLMADYFVEHPLYNFDHFRRRFRMRQELFLHIVNRVQTAEPYFRQKLNCAGNAGFTPIHKCTAAIKMLANGGPADALDDHLKMGESTVLETLKIFVNTIIELFGEEWLRPPTATEVQHILQVNACRGFPGMLGSIDCMHWEWSSCPTALHGMYRGHKGKPTLILEAVATEDLRIWHAFFGMPGSHNDINVLQRSPVFDDLANGRAPPVEFTVNNHDYHLGYYLADGIYPDWATLVKTIPAPVSNKHKCFAERQEACRKDVERAFGVLQARWKILHNPARLWKQSNLNAIVKACIILHNMILEDDRVHELPHIHNRDWPGPADPPVSNIADMMDAYTYIRNKEASHQLRNDLIEHIWEMKGSAEWAT